MPVPTPKFVQALRETIAGHQSQYPSVEDFATAAGLQKSVIYSFYRGNGTVTPLTLRRLSRVVTREEALRLYEAQDETPPADLVFGPVASECPPYCERANALAARLGVDKATAIERGLDLLERNLASA